MTSSCGGPPQDYKWRPVARIGRSCLCGPVGLALDPDRARLRRLSHLAFGSESYPNLLGSFNRVSERMVGVTRVARCPAPGSLSSRQGPMSSSIANIYHLQPHSHTHPPCAPPTRAFSPCPLAHSHPPRPCHHNLLLVPLGTLAPAARPCHHNLLPSSGIRGRHKNSKSSLAR
ncbi:hypothetical protein BC826DRAFT_168666 [Russula brevipes]|nr:hypothetical protein BC826DRAFT_168666 [Russula brevipes]